MKTIGKLIVFVCALLALAASAYAAEDSPLFEAVKKDDKAAVEALLAKGADVNAKDQEGQTPLHRAATRFGRKDIAEFLLANGADIHAKDAGGFTPLFYAVAMGYVDITELLLARGADISAKSPKGDTPLHTAVSSRNANKDVVELLLSKGADLNAKDSTGQTPLDWAADMGTEGIIELLKKHLVKQADHIKSNPRAAIRLLAAHIKGNPADGNTRRLIIKLASELKPAPAIPEEARKHFVEGEVIYKLAKTTEQANLAAQSFTEALKIAPWWGDAYYNLGRAQAQAEKYDEAEQSFNFYLLSNPSETEKRDAQDQIYALSAKRKLAGAK